ncbi:hypothetical protein [Mucilaginibacter aquariorum]|uniref:Uncharacterized protein n=1 Tax=Mucilaginibacter aquariorum TaxID=2967225 RepID=A0ABT1TA75_9SPHI|nr:hypothetical protein [Mucilaginibacter aquariorum]MCQ6961280.1 hypothetical protein [Mucilaginibacter aquariorum]
MKKKLLSLILIGLLFACTTTQAQNYNNIVNYSLNATPVNGVKIKTNIPFTSTSNMPTIILEGYNYVSASAIGLQISFYVYGTPPAFFNASISSYGNYTPPITLANEDGKVVIFINDKAYYSRFTVSVYSRGMPQDVAINFQGWTAVDEALTGTDQLLLPYKNSFAGVVNLPGSGIWNATGNVGIGTTTPGLKTHIFGITGFPATTGTAQTGVLRLQGSSSQAVLDFGVNGASGSYLQATSQTALNATYPLLLNPNGGSVSIGTTDRPAGYQLAVNGSVIATSVTVKVKNEWPDYVFKKDYKLRTLTEVKNYIDQNHHLPGMPSEKEVMANGLNLGDMNKILTKKIEELTLYLIDAEKREKDLRLQADKLQQKLEEINKKLSKAGL